jgi:hypothetical protein
MLYGSYGVELVLDKTRLPERLQPISTTAIKFYPTDNGKRLKPVQEIAGVEVDLDIPTFFYGSVDQDLLEPYSASPLEPALQPVLFSTDFMNDLRRVVKRAIHPRVTVTIDEEKFRKGIPLEFQNDQEKIAGYMASVVSEIETKVNGLKPEDALIVFDTIGIEVVDHGNTNLSNEWEALQGFANSKLATGTKTMPTILGHGSASANIASAEALLYMKTADGLVRKKLNELYSRVFTLAVRLYGIDCYVEFAYEDIDLRPKNEVEAFKAMKQSRVLELLSLGLHVRRGGVNHADWQAAIGQRSAAFRYGVPRQYLRQPGRQRLQRRDEQRQHDQPEPEPGHADRGRSRRQQESRDWR